MGYVKKKKTIIIVGILCGLFLLIGTFWLGRISVENRSSEPKNNLPPQKPKKPEDNPEPSPGSKNEGKFDYTTFFKKDNVSWYAFDDILQKGREERQDWKIIHINENHPRIKELLKEGKLQGRKEFTIRYGKVDKKIRGA